MNEARRFGWLGAGALFLAGCFATFLIIRHWPGGGAVLTPISHQTGKGQWRIQADFKLQQPIFVNDPDKRQILSFEVGRSRNPLVEYPVSIKNLSDRSYSLTYEIFAYDAQNRRVDETSDSLTITAKETVLRQLLFSHPLSVDAGTFASYRLIANIDH